MYIPIDGIHEYERNAKIHDEENVSAIKESIQRFGMCDPIGIWQDEEGRNVIVEGHGRKMALMELGHETAPCILLNHLTDEERKAYALAHNQTTLMTGFDMDALSLEMGDLADFEMEDFGFDGLRVEDAEYSDVDEAEPLDPSQVETRCKPGDAWILGDHVLVCGDSTNEADVAALMGDDAADLILTDPPYGVSYEGKTEDALTIENDEMGGDELERFLVDAFKPAFARLSPGAAFYIWHASRTQREFENALNAVGMTVRQQLIWVKNSMVLGRQDFQWRHEPCFYGWAPNAPHRWYADRRQTTVLEFDKPKRNGEHPTMKPVDLIAYQVETSTEEGHVVLDMFGGSGSTLVACEQLGRKCRTMELDPRYCDVIIERWERLTGSEAVRR